MKCKICNKYTPPPGYDVCQICAVNDFLNEKKGAAGFMDNFVRDPNAFISACHICHNNNTKMCINCSIKKVTK